MSKIVVFTRHGFGHINGLIPLLKELIKRDNEVIVFSPDEGKNAFKKIGASTNDIWIYRKKRFIPDLQNDTSHFCRRKSLSEYIEYVNYELKINTLLAETLKDKVKTIKPDLIIYNTHTHYAKQISEMQNIMSACVFTDYAYNPEWLYSHSEYTLKNWFFLKEEDYIYHKKTIEILYDMSHLYFKNGVISSDKLFWLSNGMSLARYNIIFDYRLSQLYDNEIHGNYHFYGCYDMPIIENYEKKRQILVYLGGGSYPLELKKIILSIMEAFSDEKWHILFVIPDKKIADSCKKIHNISIHYHIDMNKALSESMLFIFHGSMSGYREALYYNVPMLCIPRHGDNYVIADVIEKLGIGRKMEYQGISNVDIKAYAMEIIESNAVSRIKKLKLHNTEKMETVVNDIEEYMKGRY